MPGSRQGSVIAHAAAPPRRNSEICAPVGEHGRCRRPEATVLGVHMLGATTNPSGQWMAQQAGNLMAELGERAGRLRFLIRDRDASIFDAVFRAEGIEVVLTPPQAPRANAFAERWVRTAPARIAWRLHSAAKPERRREPWVSGPTLRVILWCPDCNR
jgi:hypothetical protein